MRVLTDPPPSGAGRGDADRATGRAERPTVSIRNRWVCRVWLAGRRSDDLLVDPGVGVVDAEVVLGGNDHPVVSDHDGVRATLALP